jgi:hypothetical protein
LITVREENGELGGFGIIRKAAELLKVLPVTGTVTAIENYFGGKKKLPG